MDLQGLNDQQKQAVLSEAPSLLVLAGAGSGKTRVLTQRIAYLIQEKGVAPWQVLAFTFTNKAAGEMKDRVARALDRPVDSLWIGTFHSICSRLLRREIVHLGYASNFTIYDAGDQASLVKQILKQGHMEDQGMSPRAILSAISLLKNRGIPVDEALDRADNPVDLLVARVYRAYEGAKKKNNALDFDDLILFMLTLMTQYPEVRDRYRDQFRYVFVDEYQDTNHAQYDLIRSFVGPDSRVFLVGDADQSIYGWRGADISNILHFDRDFRSPKTLLLEQNYRSTKRILEAANALIRHNEERKEKNLWTENGEGAPIQYRLFQSEAEEAVGLVEKIREESNVTPYKGQAILYRTNAQSRPLEEALIREGIPYRVVGGLKFYDRAEIKDLVAYMTLIINPTDDVAFRRIINQPKRGLGEKSLDNLQKLAAENGLSLMDTLLDGDLFAGLTPAIQKKFRPFLDLFCSLASQVHGPMTDFFQAVYRESGYEAMLEKSQAVEDRSRMDNIAAFYDAIAQYQDEEAEGTIVDYLQNLALMSDLDKTEEGKSGVTLMTMHSAKGLEFPIVYVAGLEDGLTPSERAMEEGHLEEERRLMYVAITRAEKKLYLSGAQVRRVFGSPMPKRPSRFIDELEGHLEKVGEDPNEPASYGGNFAASPGRRTPVHSKESFGDARIRGAYDRQRERIRELVRQKQKRLDETLHTPYRVGDKVRHRKFGLGTVVSVVAREDGDELTVTFEKKGIKRLNAALAPLTKES